MMVWVAANGGVRAIGDAGEVTVQTADWQDSATGPTLGRPVDETVTGQVSSLTVPVRSATVTDRASGQEYDLGDGVTLDAGPYVLECRPAMGVSDGNRSARGDQHGSTELAIRFDGPVAIRRSGRDLTVAFEGQEPVTVGFSECRSDPATITVPGTGDGVATAITHLSSALRTAGPERSHPSHRDTPPMVELGDEVSIPDAVADATPETGLELQVPPSMEYLFVGAPLAYYLGAEVTVTDRTHPRLVAPSIDFEYQFRELPTFQHGVARLLRQTFFFDTLVRDVDGDATDQRARLASRYGLDTEALRRCSPAERLARYFWVSDADLPQALPEWHFSTYAAPETRNVRCLPYLLDALSLVYLPESSELRGTELLERTLDDCYRSGSATSGSVASVDVVKPELQAGRVHAWLAPGAPIDAFKPTPRAYENRRRYQNDSGTELSVAVILNDEEMADEHATVSEIYRERSADLPLSVTVHEHLGRDELAEVFATPNDFVHYIGHCDTQGLQCVDGTLSASSLDACRARTFFLNACGSYHEGLDLVERGSVAGAVTLTKVLDRQAAKVGTAFARLLVHGFGLEPAMQLARRRIMMGKDYAVVGDGTYTLAPTPESPTVGWLERDGTDYRLRCEAVSARDIGDSYRPPVSDDALLHGTATETVLDTDELLDVLRQQALPVIYDSEFHWSAELAAKLTDGN
ncbi:hypothetical protein [Halorientalis salina]|uniref:hypothetical protein n=1 Tax=Halorientalis salina TaxID=2932266 RepID=UPI0010ACC88D|nr:hypothetical protein [Halorientalis salina]